jgi:hypothetical protein
MVAPNQPKINQTTQRLSLPPQLTLALLMTRVCANHPNRTMATDNLAIPANSLY